MNLFNIAAALTLNSDQYEEGLRKAQSKASGFGTALRKGLKGAGVAVAAVGTAASTVGIALVKGAGDAAAYGDNIDKMSQKLGISAEAFQEWNFILQHSGSSIDALKPAMKTLVTAASSGSDAFKELGLSQKQVASMSSEELFAATITALQNTNDESKRTELAMTLLGKSGMELGALLNTSAEDTEAMRKQVHDLGGVMSDKAVKDAAAYQDSLQNLGTATTGLKRTLLSGFMPAISTVMDGLASIFSGDSENGIAQISEGISGLSDTLLSKIPEMLPIVTQIIIAIGMAIIENLPVLTESVLLLVSELGTAIIENLPMILQVVLTIIESIAAQIGQDLPVLLPSIIQAIVSVAQMIIDNLPELLSALLLIMEGLAEGIIEALPVIIESLPAIISGIVNFLIESIPLIIEAGLQLLLALVDAMPDIVRGIVDALPEIIKGIVTALTNPDTLSKIITAGFDLLFALIEAIPDIVVALIEAMPQIITGIVTGLVNGLGRIAEVGKNLLEGLWDGIKNAASWLWNKITEWASGLLDGIKGFFGIHSPSIKFRDVIGKNLVAGLGEGIDKYADMALDSMYELADDILDAAEIDPTLRIKNGIRGLSGDGRRDGVQITQNIYAAKMAPSEVFEEAREQQERLVLLGV